MTPMHAMHRTSAVEVRQSLDARAQAYLAALWVFNFGAVMAWMPWMYRWHLQPDSDRER